MRKWETPELMKLEVGNTEHGGHHGKPGKGDKHDKDHGWGCPDVRPGFDFGKWS